jgi:hypothetical protein
MMSKIYSRHVISLFFEAFAPLVFSDGTGADGYTPFSPLDPGVCSLQLVMLLSAY